MYVHVCVCVYVCVVCIWFGMFWRARECTNKVWNIPKYVNYFKKYRFDHCFDGKGVRYSCIHIRAHPSKHTIYCTHNHALHNFAYTLLPT